MGSLNEEARMKACIYGKSGKVLTKYQEKLNQFARDLCVNPALLADRGKLFELAKDKLHESVYMFAKGKSRSKKLNPVDEARREKINQQERHHRIETLKEELQDTNKHIGVKEKRIEQAQTIQNYKLCDQLYAEVTTLKSKRREIESSLRALQRKEQRSAKYFARKASASHMKVSESHESSSTTSVTPQDPNSTTSGDVTAEPGTFCRQCSLWHQPREQYGTSGQVLNAEIIYSSYPSYT